MMAKPYPRSVSDGHPGQPTAPPFELTVDGTLHRFDAVDGSLLDLLRDRLGSRSAKDGCSPQGQCGCCTVLVDGEPRVACVTPARRVRGRSITTLDGIDPDRRSAWAEALCSTGGSQCGFCTPGIIVRLEGARSKRPEQPLDRTAVDQALRAHLCRCTGWQTIGEAARLVTGPPSGDGVRHDDPARDLVAAGRRATIEGRSPQHVAPEVSLGQAGFAADTAPDDALVALPTPQGEWVVGESLAEARAAAGSIQGRRTTVDHAWPLEVPVAEDGPWAATLRTTWVEPAHLETDASWCRPGEEPVSALANGGSFGAKTAGNIEAVAHRLADDHGRPVLALATREHAVRWGPKRPPVAAGIRSDGSGVINVVRTDGIAERIAAVAPDLEVVEVDVAGPPTSVMLRAAGWAEAAVLTTALSPGEVEVRSPEGAIARADIVDGAINVTVRCGQPLDPVVLRSYCIGAAHMGWSWLTSEALAVDAEGTIHDLTIRSFGIVRALDTPPIHVTIEDDDRPPINGSDAVFAAVAAAGWRASGGRQDWPVGAII